MGKLILMLVMGLLIIITGVIFFRSSFSNNSQTTVKPLLSQLVVPTPSSDKIEDRVRALEIVANTLIDEVKRLKTSSPTTQTAANNSDASLEDRVTALETTLKSINIGTTITNTPAPTTTQNKGDIFIPLCAETNTSDANWTNTDINCDVLLNPTDFLGYSSMQLEGNMRLNQIIGTLYARLYNVTDNSAVNSSEISTTSEPYQLVTSSGFNLASGTKTYRLQLKSSSNTIGVIKNARIRVNF